MATITCPQCQAQQQVPDEASAYRCQSCGSESLFIRCSNCNATLTALKSWRAVRCLNCGRTTRLRSAVPTIGLVISVAVAILFGWVAGWLANALDLPGVIIGIVAGLLSVAYFYAKFMQGIRGEPSHQRRGGTWFFWWSGD